MQRICGSLQKAGHSVLLIGRKLPHSPETGEFAFQTERLKCIFHKGKAFYIEFNLRLFFLLLFRPAKMIGSVDADTLPACCLASWLKRVPLSFDAHEYFSEVPELQDRKWVKNIWQWVERTFIPQADLIYTVSGSIAEEYQKFSKQKVHLIRNMPLRAQKKEGTEDAEKILIYQGALNRGRGLEALIRAAPELPLKIMIAGGGDLEKSLPALPGAGHVHFTGRKKPHELKSLTASAWLGYNLLENEGKSYYYSLANKFFDYVQAGIPQLCAAFPEYERLNRELEVALLIDEPDPEKIKAATNRLLKDPDLYHRLKKNALLAAQLWCWEEEEKKLIALYEPFRG